MQFYIYANFDRVYGQNHGWYWNIVGGFLKWNPKRSVSNNKFWNENFHFKISKKCYVLPKNGKLTFKHDKKCLDFKQWINHKASFNFNQETHIFLQVPSIDYSRSMENHRDNFSLLKGWPLFLGISVCVLPLRKWNLQDCVWGKSLFWLKIENFRYSEKHHFGGKKPFFRNSHFSQNLLSWQCMRHWHFGS